MFETSTYKKKMDQALDHFRDDLKKIRTGRAHPDMLSEVMVEAYGSRMPLNQVANSTVPEPQLLQITPFDPTTLQAIVTAIRNDQSFGFNPSDDGRVVRVPVPPLTEERRQQIVKQAHEKGEDVRIVLRVIRQDALKEAKRRKEAKEMSEDEVKRVEKEIDALMSDYQNAIDAELKAKEKEILTI